MDLPHEQMRERERMVIEMLRKWLYGARFWYYICTYCGCKAMHISNISAYKKYIFIIRRRYVPSSNSGSGERRGMSKVKLFLWTELCQISSICNRKCLLFGLLSVLFICVWISNLSFINHFITDYLPNTTLTHINIVSLLASCSASIWAHPTTMWARIEDRE